MEELNEEDALFDLKSIGDKYEEKGYFIRLKDMFVGLGKPRNTPEYKIARLELQRQSAPLIAFLSVLMFFVILVVVTQMQEEKEEEIVVTQVQEQKPDEEPPPEEEPPPPPDPEPVEVEVEIDVVNPGPVSDITPQPSPPSNKVSTKPAPVNSVANVISPVSMKSMLGSRNPGSIGAATRGGNGYGDSRTEACVLKVLWWLKATQDSDGGWSKNGSGSKNKLANTALAVLTYLAHGEFPGAPSPYRKDFGPVVQKAINFIMKSVKQTPRSVTMEGSDKNEYAFLIATYALCEAFGMTKNPDIKDIAMVCLERIVKSQSATGGWDYHLNKNSDRDDVSYAGWAIQALKAGKMAGLKPKGLDECIKKAIHCLVKRNFDNGTFRYTAKQRQVNHPGLAPVGCLAMQLLGYGANSEVAAALNYMRSWKPSYETKDIPHRGEVVKSNYCPQYYCYYATQCKYQAGMKEGATKVDQQDWFNWNKQMKEFYTTVIKDLPEPVKDWSGQNHKQGYYVNKDNFSTRPYMDSCLVALQLMVYYRYLPTTQTAAGKEDSGEEDASEKAVDKGDIGVTVDF